MFIINYLLLIFEWLTPTEPRTFFSEPPGSLDCGGPPPLLNFNILINTHKFKSARGLAHSKDALHQFQFSHC